MPAKFRVLFILTQSPGVNWYRCISFAKKFNCEVEFWPPQLSVRPNWEDVMVQRMELLFSLEKAVDRANVIVCQRICSRIGMAMLMGMKSRYKKKFLCEIDDNVFAVDSANPGFYAVYPGSDAEHYFQKQLGFSDGVVVSTENLKKAYSKYNKKIWVIKNSIDLGKWNRLKKPAKKDDKIRIGWQGASHHFDDLRILAGVVPKILRKFKEVEFHFCGLLPDFLRQERVFYHVPVEHKDYPQAITNYGFDFMLAPLNSSLFNESKSNLRILEIGAMGKTCVASGGARLPYVSTISNVVDGILAQTEEDWVAAIEFMVEHPETRGIMARSLHKKIEADYDIRNTAAEYETLLRNCEVAK